MMQITTSSGTVIEVSEKTLRIAEAGAKKMAGYTYEAASVAGAYYVSKPEEGEPGEYFVNLAETLCSCPFCRENFYCKHLRWLAQEIDDVARWEAMAADRELCQA